MILQIIKNSNKNPKEIDQSLYLPSGLFSENGKFFNAALKFKKNNNDVELIKVYEKIKPGIWVYNGIFKLVDAWEEQSNNRKVFKFKLELINNDTLNKKLNFNISHNKLIPSNVKLEVWKRDKGRCVLCGSNINLHFDHIIPFSRGGSSVTAKNIQILCAKCNLAKNDKII